MAVTWSLCLLALLATASAFKGETKVTPVEKVLELMQKMMAEGTAALQDEKVKFAAFNQWCTDETKNKQEEIATANDKIEFLKAEIFKMETLIKDLTARIEELEEDVARWKKDQKSAMAVREKETFDYQATLTDYDESLAAIDGAIGVLQKRSADVPQALLQVRQLRRVPEHVRSALDVFLKGTGHSAALVQAQQPNVEATDAQMPDDQLFYAAPEANAYEFQSGGIIEMLEKLKDQFEKQKYDLEKDELNARHGFDAIMQQLTDNIENAEHEIAKKTADRAATVEAKAKAEGDLAQTIADRDEDQKYLDEMTALCDQKKKDFESRSALRTEELEVIKKAMEIISSESVKGTGEKHLPTLVQQESARSFAQLRSFSRSPEQRRVAAFLAQRAKLIGSRTLEMISLRVEEDPFKKVKKMIKDLVYKLMEEAREEAEHKGWCDTELVTNQQTRQKKAAEVAELTQQIEDLTAEIAALTQDIEDLTAAIAELDAAMAKATADREASKAKNTETIAEAKEAQEAVESAMAILKEFYAKASEATALTQGPADDAPETFGAPYKGMQTKGGGIMDFLEVILSDFARLQSETETAEAMEQEEYEKYMHECNKDKALKENEIQHKEERKTMCETDLARAKEELAEAQAALDAAVAYYEKLKPTCVDSGITYEERVKQREEEIQSLKEALAMLEGLELPSVGKPAMKFNTYEESEYESKETKTVKFEASAEFSASSSMR